MFIITVVIISYGALISEITCLVLVVSCLERKNITMYHPAAVTMANKSIFCCKTCCWQTAAGAKGPEAWVIRRQTEARTEGQWEEAGVAVAATVSLATAWRQPLATPTPA